MYSEKLLKRIETVWKKHRNPTPAAEEMGWGVSSLMSALSRCRKTFGERKFPLAIREHPEQYRKDTEFQKSLQERNQKIVDMWKKGMILEDIRRETGVAISTLSVVIKRARETLGETTVPSRRGRSRSALERDRAYVNRLSGLWVARRKTSAIAEELGVSTMEVLSQVCLYRTTYGEKLFPHRRNGK